MTGSNRAIILAATVAALFASSSVRAENLQKVTMHLDFLVNGYHAPFYVAEAKGWYREAGLDVTIRPGKGSADSIKTVGTGQAEFGFPDFGATIKAIADDIPVTAVAAFVQQVPAGIISFTDNPVDKPKDLEGKSIAVAPFGATALMMPAWAKINGVDLNKVDVKTYNFGAMVPSFLTGKVDTTVGYAFGEYLAARTKSENRQVKFLAFADWGIDAYSNGIIVSNAFMEANPKAIEAFVKVSLRGLVFALGNKEEAIAATAKHTETPAETLLAQLELAERFYRAPGAEKRGWGVMTDEQWRATQEIQVKFNNQKTELPLDRVYTNRFVK